MLYLLYRVHYFAFVRREFKSSGSLSWTAITGSKLATIGWCTSCPWYNKINVGPGTTGTWGNQSDHTNSLTILTHWQSQNKNYDIIFQWLISPLLENIWVSFGILLSDNGNRLWFIWLVLDAYQCNNTLTMGTIGQILTWETPPKLKAAAELRRGNNGFPVWGPLHGTPHNHCPFLILAFDMDDMNEDELSAQRGEPSTVCLILRSHGSVAAV